MQNYKYTYQDWVNHRLKPNNLYKYYVSKHISLEDFRKIGKEQENTYLKRLKETFEILKHLTKTSYKLHLVKEEFLKYKIEDFQEHIDLIIHEDNDAEIRESVINSHAVWRDITRLEVEEYLYSDWHDWSLIKRVVFENCYHKTKNFTAFDYILFVNLLNWLKWYQKEEENKSIEPKIKFPASTSNEDDETSRLAFVPDYYFNNFLNSENRKNLSYNWHTNQEEELPELYKLMIGRFINETTTLKQFKAVFTGEHIDNVSPIKWHDNNASELLYFILQLESTNCIVPNGNRADYKKLKACFAMPDGNPFTASFKSLKQNINIDLSIEKQQAINELVRNF